MSSAIVFYAEVEPQEFRGLVIVGIVLKANPVFAKPLICQGRIYIGTFPASAVMLAECFE